jgi:hypothetical protein
VRAHVDHTGCGSMLNIMTVRFMVERDPQAGYVGSCSELGVRLAAANLATLEQKMISFARSLVEEPGVPSTAVLVHRHFAESRFLM